eukprot:59732-Chlamydomonas_euryale.AAC.1
MAASCLLLRQAPMSEGGGRGCGGGGGGGGPPRKRPIRISLQVGAPAQSTGLRCRVRLMCVSVLVGMTASGKASSKSKA